MFKGRSARAGMLAVVLLLGMLMPLGAGAQSAKPTTVRIGIDAYLDANGHWEAESGDVEDDALSGELSWIQNDFPGKEIRYEWSLCDSTFEKVGFIYSSIPQQSMYSTRNGADEAKTVLTSSIGKDLFKCELWCEGSCRSTVFYYIQKYIDMPAAQGTYPDTEYVYFEEGKELTIQIKTPLKIASGDIWYSWFKENDDGYYTMVKQNTSDPFFTFTPTAADDGKKILWSASQKGVEYWASFYPQYILQNKAKNPIILPGLTSSYTEMELAEGQSETLRLPPAQTGDPSKTLEYRWYKYDPYNDKTELVKAGNSPELKVQYDAKYRNLVYTCKVGYAGDESSFLDYNYSFYVAFTKTPVGPTDPDPITVPSVANPDPYYFLEKNQSVKLSVPKASGDPSKKLNYNWYANKNGEFFEYVASTDTPELQVTHTGKESGKVYYICDVGYSDDYTYDSYAEYNVLFTVEFASGSSASAPSVPKTGDNTPLTALLLLLGVSLAGATLLVGMRRRQGHS